MVVKESFYYNNRRKQYIKHKFKNWKKIDKVTVRGKGFKESISVSIVYQKGRSEIML